MDKSERNPKGPTHLKIAAKIAVIVVGFSLFVGIAVGPVFGSLNRDTIYKHPIGFRGHTVFLTDSLELIDIASLWVALIALIVACLLKIRIDRSNRS